MNTGKWFLVYEEVNDENGWQGYSTKYIPISAPTEKEAISKAKEEWSALHKHGDLWGPLNPRVVYQVML